MKEIGIVSEYPIHLAFLFPSYDVMKEIGIVSENPIPGPIGAESW
jgi:hypothetical protein